MYTHDDVRKTLDDIWREHYAHIDAPVPTPDLTPADTDKSTKQLLNELYHDRARLQRVVKAAAKYMRKVLEGAGWSGF